VPAQTRLRFRLLRRAVALLAAAACALPLAACTAATPPAPTTITPTATLAASPKHPNIVFVLADDYAMNLVSHMPNLQRMQADGRTMSRYYVVDSLCCPSRSSILTGRYPHDTGVFTNAGTDGGISAFHTYGDQRKCFAEPMQRAGYRTAFMGKYLNGYTPQTMPPEPGWNEWDVGGAGGYAEFGYTLNENGTPVHYGHKASDYMVDVLSRKAAGFIRTTAATKQPFMLEVATYAPHDPFVPPPRYAGTLADVPYPRTAAWNATVQDAPKWLRGHVPLRPSEKALIKQDWERRLEADLAVDDLLANVRRAVADSGIANDTDVVFSSDNGLHMGEYRLTPGKETAFDTDVHVPLVVAGPGVPAGTTSDALTSSIDLAPTFLTLTGVGADPSADGTSLASVWHGADPPDWQQGVLIEHHHRQGVPGDPDLQNTRSADPPGYIGVRTRDALYVRYADGEQEYYDTAKDPSELHDIAGKGVPQRLQRMLSALERCHGAASCQAAARTS
jgi:N-acetylglucosamine-6-sulfatase